MASEDKQPGRGQLEAICDVAGHMVLHIKRYWSIDGNALSEPAVGAIANPNGLRHVAELLDAVKSQRRGNHPGPIVEWQLRELVWDWRQLRAGSLAFSPDVFLFCYRPPAELVESTPVPDFWHGWPPHVPQALRAVVKAAEKIVYPLGRSAGPTEFVGGDVDALDQAVRSLREAILFLPSEIQEVILEHLDGHVANGDELLTMLNCGSKETLYGKKRRGGLTELVNLGLVKNSRSRGGYYRPDKPPVQKAY